MKPSTLIFIFLITTNVCAQSIFDIARSGSGVQAEKILVTQPENANTINKDGYTPLILAAYHGNYEVVQVLLKYVSSIDTSSNNGTALMAATVKGHASIVALLLSHDADPDHKDGNGNTALLYTSMFSSNKIAKLLLEAKADPSIKDKRGMNALDYAQVTKNEQLVTLLKQYL